MKCWPYDFMTRRSALLPNEEDPLGPPIPLFQPYYRGVTSGILFAFFEISVDERQISVTLGSNAK